MSGEPTVGQGQQDPSDTSNEVNQADFHIRQVLGRISTMKPVKIVAVYDNAGKPITQTGNTGIAGFVDVQPLVNQIDGQGNALSHGIINGVPYARLQGGKNGIINDPQPGDITMMVCADRDISSVKANRGQANPGSFRQFDPADGICFGTIVGDPPDQYVRYRPDGVDYADKNGNLISTGPNGTTIKDKSGNVIDMTAGGITVTPASGPVKVVGDLQVTGSLIGGFGTGDAVGLQTHTHTQPVDSHGDTEAPTNPPTPGT